MRFYSSAFSENPSPISFLLDFIVIFFGTLNSLQVFCHSLPPVASVLQRIFQKRVVAGVTIFNYMPVVEIL
jgi:hypothetical protein